MSTPLRVAIAGAGIGAAHLQGYLAHRQLFHVVTICDLDEQRAQRLAETAGSETNGDYKEALARDDVDLLDICLPPRLHRQAILDALAADKHVICEKPLVGSLAAADEVIAAASASSFQVMPIFQYRFGNGLNALQQLIHRDLVGRPLTAALETHWNRGPSYYSLPWRGKWASELGGAVVGHAIHAHDLLTQVMGPIEAVQARLATRVNDIEVEDCAAIGIELASGALATSSVTLGSARNQSRLRFCFSRLSAETDKGVDPYNPGAARWHFTARDSKKQASVDAALAEYRPHVEGFARQFELIYKAIVEDDRAPVTLADARASLALISAIYLSHREARRVTLAEVDHCDVYHDWTPTTLA